jgi:hypothetical protein
VLGGNGIWRLLTVVRDGFLEEIEVTMLSAAGHISVTWKSDDSTISGTFTPGCGTLLATCTVHKQGGRRQRRHFPCSPITRYIRRIAPFESTVSGNSYTSITAVQKPCVSGPMPGSSSKQSPMTGISDKLISRLSQCHQLPEPSFWWFIYIIPDDVES